MGPRYSSRFYDDDFDLATFPLFPNWQNAFDLPLHVCLLFISTTKTPLTEMTMCCTVVKFMAETETPVISPVKLTAHTVTYTKFSFWSRIPMFFPPKRWHWNIERYVQHHPRPSHGNYICPLNLRLQGNRSSNSVAPVRFKDTGSTVHLQSLLF